MEIDNDILIQEDIPNVFLQFLKEIETEYSLPAIDYSVCSEIHSIFTAIPMELNLSKIEANEILQIVNTILALKYSLEKSTGIQISNTSGKKQKVEITDKNTIQDMLNFLEMEFHFNYGRGYENGYEQNAAIQIKEKNKIEDKEMWDYYLDKECYWEAKAILYRNFEPYTVDELNLVSRYIKSLISEKNNELKNRLKARINKCVNLLKAKNIFDKDYKTISTNEASFLYDLMNYFNIVLPSETMNKQEKYQFIKRSIK